MPVKAIIEVTLEIDAEHEGQVVVRAKRALSTVGPTLRALVETGAGRMVVEPDSITIVKEEFDA